MIKGKIKYILITAISILTLQVAGIIFLKIYFNVKYPENRLKEFLSEFCKESLGKAVKFEGISITYAGNIVIKNFDLSISSDFNDNTSFIQSKKTVVDINFIKLFKDTIQVEGISFEDSTISVHKTYGKGYIENFKTLFSFLDTLKQQKFIDLNNFTVSCRNSTIYYHEFFKEHKLTIECPDSSLNIKSDEEKFTCDLDCDIIPYKTKEISRGELQISSRYYYDKTKESYLKIDMDNFDTSVFTEYVQEHELGQFLFSGGLSAKLALVSQGDEYKLKGDVETNNLSLISGQTQQFDIISNGNFNSEVDMRFSIERNFITFNKFRFYDDNCDIKFSGNYSDFKDNREVRFKIKTNTIDLEALSRYLTPAKDISYAGTLAYKADFHYDMKSKKIISMNSTARLKDFFLYKQQQGKPVEYISDAAVDIDVADSVMKLNSAFKSGKSDFVIKGKTDIKTLEPLITDTSLKVSSKRINATLLYDGISMGINSIFKNAYEDQKKGYDEIFFLQKPLASFINGNNVSLDWSVGSVHLGGEAALSNLSCQIKMDKGTLTVDDFNMEGYNAAYRLELQGYFNRDYPFITVKGSVNQFDLEKLSKDLNKDYSFSGTCNIDFDYEINAYRLFQILQNSKSNVMINVTQGRIKNTDLQKRITAFLSENGQEVADITSIEFNNFSLSMAQSGGSFYIRNFALNSNMLTFSAYGTYDYSAGLKVPTYLYLRNSDGKTANIPMEISGCLENPRFLFKTVSKEPVVLFPDVQ